MKNLIVFLLLSLSLHLTSATSFDIDIDGSNSDLEWVEILGTPAGSYPGRVMSNIGDFNGDGIDDMMMNAANSGHSEVTYVIYGQKDGFSQDTISVTSTYSEGFAINGPFVGAVFTNFAYGVSKSIDLNGDGLSDIVFAASSYTNLKGMVYVIYGKKDHTGDITINSDYTFPSSVEGFVIVGPAENSQFGYSLSTTDWNGDGFDDILTPCGQIYQY